MKTCFIHSRVILGRTLSECAVVVEGEKILYVGEHPGDLSGMRVIDGKGLYLSPGFVDIHVHGGGGFGVMDCSPDGILRMCETHLAHGTTSILPTTLAAPALPPAKGNSCRKSGVRKTGFSHHSRRSSGRPIPFPGAERSTKRGQPIPHWGEHCARAARYMGRHPHDGSGT